MIINKFDPGGNATSHQPAAATAVRDNHIVISDAGCTTSNGFVSDVRQAVSKSVVPIDDTDAEDPLVPMVFVVGAPRSGTTWVGKIFDSHPDVLYRHEPDTIDRDGQSRMLARDSYSDRVEAARTYVHRIARIGRLKSAGQMPLFRKSYHSTTAHVARAALIGVLRAAEQVPALRASARAVDIPDLVRASRRPRLVLKSVSSCRCAGLYADAVPRSRIVFILRNPFGQVASMLRGVSLGKLARGGTLNGLWEWQEAKQHGLTRALFERLPAVEQFAWFWTMLNSKAITDLAGRRNARVVTYAELCENPLGATRALFAFANLGWSAQTEAFLARSRQASVGGYFRVIQDTAWVSRRWREELSTDDQRRIAAIARRANLTARLPQFAEVLEAA